MVRPSSFAIIVIGLVPASFLSRVRSSSLHDCFQRAMSPGPATQALRPTRTVIVRLTKCSQSRCAVHGKGRSVTPPRSGTNCTCHRRSSLCEWKVGCQPAGTSRPTIPCAAHRAQSAREEIPLTEFVRMQSSGAKRRETAASCLLFKLHANLSKSIIMCAAAARPNVITPMRACAEKYWRNNVALRCDPESTDPALWRAAQCSLAPRPRPH